MSSRADPTISFDLQGVCSHCQRYDALVAARVLKGEAGERALESLVAKIKTVGRKREYDCIIGVSGGVDSTYVAYLTRKLGLRPLAVHFDNGWNSELATQNIESVLRRLDIDLYTYVVDWAQFRDLQVAFLKASTPDGEIPSDHAINALLWREAAKRDIRFIVTGMNFTTESISVPDWSYGHSDWRYIKDVHRRFGSVPLKSYPHFTPLYVAYLTFLRNIRSVSILNYMDYNKTDVMTLLENELGWVNYGGKHHESIYTRFFQGYILPRKFSIDKRYGHLSDLINAGQLTRDEALREIQLPTYDPKLQEQDLIYVCKKLGLTRSQFDQMMTAKPRSFREFRNSYATVQFMRRMVNRLRGAGIYPR